MKTLVALFTLVLLTFGISFAGQAENSFTLDELTIASYFDSDFVASTFFTPEVIEEAGRSRNSGRRGNASIVPTFFTPEVIEEAGRRRPGDGGGRNVTFTPAQVDLDNLYTGRRRPGDGGRNVTFTPAQVDLDNLYAGWARPPRGGRGGR